LKAHTQTCAHVDYITESDFNDVVVSRKDAVTPPERDKVHELASEPNIATHTDVHRDSEAEPDTNTQMIPANDPDEIRARDVVETIDDPLPAMVLPTTITDPICDKCRSNHNPASKCPISCSTCKMRFKDRRTLYLHRKAQHETLPQLQNHPLNHPPWDNDQALDEVSFFYFFIFYYVSYLTS